MRRLQVSSSVMPADMKGTTDETGKPGKRSRDRRSVSGRPARMEALVPLLSTLRSVKESICLLILVLLLALCPWVLHLQSGCES